MKFIETVTEKINAAFAWLRAFFAPVGRVLAGTFNVLMAIWSYIVKLRKIFLSVPVALAALWLAKTNLERLPAQVGLDLQTDGSFALMISREWACWIPFLITLFCIVLMCCSKRVLTPWVVSVVTLILPVFVWFTNIFPA